VQPSPQVLISIFCSVSPDWKFFRISNLNEITLVIKQYSLDSLFHTVAFNCKESFPINFISPKHRHSWHGIITLPFLKKNFCTNLFFKPVYDVRFYFTSLLCFRKINCLLYLFTHFLCIKSLINKYNTKTHLNRCTVTHSWVQQFNPFCKSLCDSSIFSNCQLSHISD